VSGNLWLFAGLAGPLLSTIFISHSSRDNEAARAMQVWLEGRGLTGVFLDFDPALGIPVGVDWEQELYQRLRACRAVVALVSPAWLASPWCFFELRQARFLGKAIFPVRIAPCDSGPILGDIQEGDLVADPDSGHRQLWEGLQRAGLDPATMLHYDPSRPPYPGLQALQEADAAVFFGRDEDISGGLDALASLRRTNGARLLLLLGASGSGKSSLLRAGLLPRLRRDPQSWAVVEPFRPGERPFDELASALVAAGSRLGLEAEGDAVRDLVRSADPKALLGLLDELGTTAGCREGAALLVIDQAEELLGPAAEAASFLTLLRGTLEAAGGRVMAVATLRSDLLGSLQNHPVLEDLAYATRTIDPLPRRALPEVIEGPAEVAGLDIGPGLTSRLIEDAATADALPLLAFTLHELYRRRRGGVLDLDLYDKLGGLEGSVRRAADGLIQSLDPDPAALTTLRDVFVGSLVRSDDDGKIVRRLAFRDELPADALPLLQHFVDARLLVAGRDARGRETLEVAHEALLRTWPRLRAWLEEDHERLRLREACRRAALAWDAAGRGEDWLDHRGARLEAVEALMPEPRFALAAGAEADYLAACREREGREQARAAAEAQAERRRLEAEAEAAAAGEAAARRVATRTRIAAAVTLVLAIAASGAGFLAWQSGVEASLQRDAAEAALADRDRADSLRLAANARAAGEAGDSELAIRLALAALPRAVAAGTGPPDTERAAEALRLAVLRHWQMVPLEGHSGAIRNVVFAPDGQRLLSASLDGTARLWDADGTELAVLRGHAGPVWRAVFATGDERIATASADGTVRLWDGAGNETAVLAGHTDQVLALALAPDGETLLSASIDGTARLWPLLGGDPRVLPHHAGVGQAVFSADGAVVLAVADDGTASLWDTATGKPIGRLDGGSAVLAVAAPHQPLLLTVGEDGTGWLWHQDGRPIDRLVGLRGWPNAAAFSPDGTRVAIAVDNLVHLFEVATARPVMTIRSPQDLVTTLAFSPDGAWLAAAGHDGTAMLFDAATGAAPLLFEEAAGRALRALAFAPDGGRLVTAGDDGTARLYRIRRFADFEALLAYATSLGLAPLGPEERSTYFLGPR
jgi:WD40 repeat protein